MHIALRVLFWVAATGSVTSSIYCGMVVAAAGRFALRRRRDERVPADFLPRISVLKPLHGTEEGMERNLETFFSRTIRITSCCSARGTIRMRGCGWRSAWAHGIRK